MFIAISTDDSEHALGSIPDPPPPPKEPGDWFLLRGSHWFSRDHGVNLYWATMTDDAIQSVISSANLYEVGLINAQQLGLFQGALQCPHANRSSLQHQVYEFINVLATTNHPLAPWNRISHGIRKDVNGVWSPYDLVGYRFIHELNNLHAGVQSNHGNEYMLRIVNAILRDPGRYSRLVLEYYPDVHTLPSNDPTDVTFLDSYHVFNSDWYTQIDVKAVLHYMWDILKIPRQAARFNLEPYVQLSSRIESAVGVWLNLVDPTARNAPPISYCSSMTEPQAEVGLHFLGEESMSFECGPVPFKDKSTGAVLWQIPPRDSELAVTCMQLHKEWMSQEHHDAFEQRHCFRQWTLGYFEYL
jgi:hypothetical protein